MENKQTPEPALPDNQDIRGILEENSKLLREVHASNVRLERYVKLDIIWGALRLLIIIIPIVFGVIILKPYIQDAAKIYQELFGAPGTAGTNPSLNILEELRKYQQIK